MIARRHPYRMLLPLLPVLVAILAGAGTAAFPRSIAHGNIQTGPKGLAYLKPVRLDYRPTLTWGPGKRSVVLVAHPRVGCTVHLLRTTTTAPGRIEVTAVETGTSCRSSSRATERFTLPLPLLPDPRRSVQVLLGPAKLRLHYSPARPHPNTALDAN